MRYRKFIVEVNNIRFTNDEIRKFKGYEHLTDDEASKLADFLAIYAIIVYNNLNNDLYDGSRKWYLKEIWKRK